MKPEKDNLPEQEFEQAAKSMLALMIAAGYPHATRVKARRLIKKALSD